MSKDGLKESGGNWTIMVSSFDDNCDLWPLFFHYFFKFWPDAPKPIHLVTNFRRYCDSRVVSVNVGEDVSWGCTTLKALKMIDADYVWLLLDDFFLKAEVDGQRVNNAVSTLCKLGGDYLDTWFQGDAGDSIRETEFRRMPSNPALAGINSAICRRAWIESLIRPDASPWQANTEFNKLNAKDNSGFYYLRNEVPPLISFVEAVKGKFWKPEAIEYMRNTNLAPNLLWRPFPPQGQGFLPKLIRSIHKKRMGFRKTRDQTLLRNGSISPEVNPRF